uniref:UDP-glucose 6-dehydrogenase 1-like isoform X1 n=1 Tax=Rhizophora mucronata TaxID=61149 RepID=A0A2P2IYL3_RHIMU
MILRQSEVPQGRLKAKKKSKGDMKKAEE